MNDEQLNTKNGVDIQVHVYSLRLVGQFPNFVGNFHSFVGGSRRLVGQFPNFVGHFYNFVGHSPVYWTLSRVTESHDATIVNTVNGTHN